MVQKSANSGEIKGKDGKYAFACQFTWGVNFRANAVFTIFALYLTLVYTFLHQICTE